MERISTYQLFSITTLFQIGTTIIFGFAASAGRDAWIAVLISTGIGVLITFGNIVLMRLHPGLTLVEWYPKQWGKWIGTPIAWLYPLLFIYIAGRIISDLTFLIPATLMPQTPPLYLLIFFMLPVAYALFHGIEVIGRLGGILLIILILLFTFEVILLLFDTEIYNVRNILPLAGEGINVIWQAVWPNGVTQTFGEIITFGLIWPLVLHQNHILKTALLSTVLTGLFLVISDILAVLTLGDVIFQRSYFPLYLLLTKVSFADFLENLDVFGVTYFFVTAFFKTTIYLFAAIRSIEILTVMKSSSRKLVIPTCLTALFVGMTMSDNIMEHITGVHLNILSPYLWVPLLLVLPSLLLITALIRKGIENS